MEGKQMNFLQLLKSLIPVLKPLGEQGVNQLFDLLEGEVAKMSDSNDGKVLLQCLLPGLRKFAILEVQKI
jgi:hypothetical protein